MPLIEKMPSSVFGIKKRTDFKANRELEILKPLSQIWVTVCDSCNTMSHFNKNLLNKNSLYKCEPQSFKWFVSWKANIWG